MISKPAFGDHKRHVYSIIAEARSAVDPYAITRAAIAVDDTAVTTANTTFNPTQRLFVVAVGKAAVPMATAVADTLAPQIYAGIALTKRGQTQTAPPERFITYFAEHPVSDQSSVDGASRILALLAQTGPKDVVLFLISGGASSLCTHPLIPLDEWQSLSRALLASGCTILEFNTVRSQLDRVKGGGLARAAAPATCVTLLLSDVVGNPVELIGSGPTVPSQKTASDALAVLDKYGINHDAARQALRARLFEKADLFEADVAIVGDVRRAAEAAVSRTVALGFDTMLLTTYLTGEASEVGKLAAGIAKTVPPGTCIIMGGETTVTLQGGGIGGRNLELALAAAIELANVPNTTIATFATDGDDGTTMAAGAIVTGQTVPLATQRGLDATAALAQNDSYTFFEALGDHLIVTGQTGTNVNDLLLILVY